MDDCDDPVRVYLREVGSIPRLTRAQQVEILTQVLAGDEQSDYAGKTLIEANLALVVSIAPRHPSPDVHVLDLIQKGNDGLMLALKTFIENPGVAFSAHAANCVGNAISEALADARRRPPD